jgi:adenylate kinase family enzyme
MFLVISGISGSGKSTVGRYLSKELNMPYLDLDEFYLPQKPIVTLSSGRKIKNWDTFESLDFSMLDFIIHDRMTNSGNLIFTGFAMRDEIFSGNLIPDCHIHLSTGKNKEEIIDRCIAARKQSKNLSDVDELVVKELVYPFYVETLSKSTIHHTIYVYNDNSQRKTVEEIAREISENLPKLI